MNANRKHEALTEAADLGLLYYGQVKPLVDFLEKREKKRRAALWNGTSVVLYLGALLAVVAGGLFSNLALEKWGAPALLVLSAFYFLATMLGAIWFDLRHYRVPACFLALLMIAVTPIGIFAIEQLLGYWPQAVSMQFSLNDIVTFDGRRFCIYFGTMLVALWTQRRFAYGILVLPALFTIFLMAMDLLPLLSSSASVSLSSDEVWIVRKKILLVFSLSTLAAAFLLDLRSRSRRAKIAWMYFSGLSFLLTSLLCLDDGSLQMRLLFVATGIFLFLMSATLQRRQFAVFGGACVSLTLVGISWSLFRDSFAFVAMLSLFALILTAVGVWWNRSEDRISRMLRSLLPESVQSHLMWRH